MATIGIRRTFGMRSNLPAEQRHVYDVHCLADTMIDLLSRHPTVKVETIRIDRPEPDTFRVTAETAS